MLSLEWRAKRKGKNKLERDEGSERKGRGKVGREREEEKGKSERERENMIADIAISLFPWFTEVAGEVLLTWLQLENMTAAEGNDYASLMERKVGFSYGEEQSGRKKKEHIKYF